ncbi:MAG: hypothetical protein HKN12_00285 [Gemmatimonadetes bacterium]|nr:hypothetical protein [Gemmatimonadota bacterium]
MTHAASPSRARPLAIAALALTLAAPAAADAAGPSRLLRVSVGPVGGTIILDQHLRDFRWDTEARTVWGAAGRAEVGRFGAGVRAWRTQTTQDTGIPGMELRPDVNITGGDLLGETRLFSVLGVRMLATGSVGLLHIGYSPDNLLVDDGTGSTVQVNFNPITEWTAGLGLGVRRGVIGGLEASVGVDHSWFRMDTTHRVGSEIVQDRELFGNWTARVELTHHILQI